MPKGYNHGNAILVKKYEICLECNKTVQMSKTAVRLHKKNCSNTSLRFDDYKINMRCVRSNDLKYINQMTNEEII